MSSKYLKYAAATLIATNAGALSCQEEIQPENNNVEVGAEDVEINFEEPGRTEYVLTTLGFVVTLPDTTATDTTHVKESTKWEDEYFKLD